MRIVGHRGTPTTRSCPENTLPAVQAALRAGVDGVEVDVRTTRDGVLVLSHDPDLGRVLTGRPGTGPVVADTDWAVLRRLALRDGTGVPRLTVVLDLVAAYDAHVVVEVKADQGPGHLRTARLVADLLRARRDTHADRVTTTSFDLASAALLADRGSVAGGVLVDAHAPAWPAALVARAHGMSELHLSVDHVRADPSIVERVHGLGLGVGAGIVDDPSAARWLALLGVDVLCTDAPSALGHAVVRHGARRTPRPVALAV